MYYTVAVGRKTGVFLSWGLTSPAVVEYPGAIFRKWGTLQDAVHHLHQHGIESINVHTVEGTMSLAEYSARMPVTNDEYFSVVIGKKRGVFTNWLMCHASVTDYPGAIYRKWNTLSDATQHLNKYGMGNEEILVHTYDDPIPLTEYCLRNDACLPQEADYENNAVFDIKNGLYVEVKRTDDGIGVDIHQRDWESGARRSNSILLSEAQWNALLLHEHNLFGTFQKVKLGEPVSTSYCLGEGVFASVNHPYRVFHIRRWLLIDDQMVPSREEGIALRALEWIHIMNIIPLITRAIVALR